MITTATTAVGRAASLANAGYGQTREALERLPGLSRRRTRDRENLTILTQAHALRIITGRSNGALEAKGVQYRAADGQIGNAFAANEVILCAGAIGSPHSSMLSGIGPYEQLKSVGAVCEVDSPEVGKHLKDHIQVPLFSIRASAVCQ